MALSLQDQLLKAGLADKKKAKQVKREKHKKVKLQQKHKVVEVDEAKVAAQQAREEKLARDKALNLQAKQEAEKKAIEAQIKQLISVNRQAKGNGDVPCNFTDGNVVKRIYVDEQTHSKITIGKLAIVKFEDGYELVPTPVADKIAQREESVVVYRADKLEEDQARESSSQEDDWYADYEIPDDLMW